MAEENEANERTEDPTPRRLEEAHHRSEHEQQEQQAKQNRKR